MSFRTSNVTALSPPTSTLFGARGRLAYNVGASADKQRVRDSSMLAAGSRQAMTRVLLRLENHALSTCTGGGIKNISLPSASQAKSCNTESRSQTPAEGAKHTQHDCSVQELECQRKEHEYKMQLSQASLQA